MKDSEGHNSTNREILYEIDGVSEPINGKRALVRESCITLRKANYVTSLPLRHIKALHPLEFVGVDTCSAVSVSTERADFIYLDESREAKESVTINGVGSGGPDVIDKPCFVKLGL
jgi:hypothetical protein